MEWLGAVWNWATGVGPFSPVMVPIATGVIGVLYFYARRLWQRAWTFFTTRSRALKAVARTTTREGACEGNGVWLTRPTIQPDNYANDLAASRILAIANLKGGVGKTTLAANLGAYFARDGGLRVLMIDLDFQGSLSSMAFPQDVDWVPRPGESSPATQLISGDVEPNEVRGKARVVDIADTGRGSLSVITAFYDLAQADNRILVEWFLKPRWRTPKNILHVVADFLRGKLLRSADIRYTLAELLHSKAVRDAYDLVIIDCPPRLTTSEVQAFCACTHLLIPTIFDRPSSEAVVTFHDQVETLKREGICPHLKYVGVVGSKWRRDLIAGQRALEVTRSALARRGSNLEILPEENFFAQSTALVNDADQGIAYLEMDRRAAARDGIVKLARTIVAKMGLPIHAGPTMPAMPTAPPNGAAARNGSRPAVEERPRLNA